MFPQHGRSHRYFWLGISSFLGSRSKVNPDSVQCIWIKSILLMNILKYPNLIVWACKKNCKMLLLKTCRINSDVIVVQHILSIFFLLVNQKKIFYQKNVFRSWNSIKQCQWHKNLLVSPIKHQGVLFQNILVRTNIKQNTNF